MLLPLDWLKKYVEVNVSPAEFESRMVMLGFEAEGYTELHSEISNVKVGRVLSVEKHPNADKLQVCMVDVGLEDSLQIVTGAPNVKEDILTPIALVGATLPGGIVIKNSKLRGIESFGMMCSGRELVIKNDDYEGAETPGILILREEYAPGTDIKEALGLGGVVFDFDLTADRPDCMSIIGMAKESAIALDKDAQFEALPALVQGEEINRLCSIEVKDTDLCPRYMGAMVKNIKIKPSPVWMQKLLKSAGVRPVNNIVDITNYVMLEHGQPMHAFDYNYLINGKIIVRRAEEGERLITLDGKERELTSEMLVIADEQRAIGIAGVMGGENSEITADTEMVLFESALFNDVSIRNTSKALGMSTDASVRFSKGLDIMRPMFALRRALQLVEELGAGKIVNGYIDVLNAPIAKNTVRASVQNINALLGIELDEGYMAQILESLDIETTVEDGILNCVVPYHRGDLQIEADIAEEVGRIYGYDNIPTTLMRGELIRGSKNEWQTMLDLIRTNLCAYGLSEIITYSFTGPFVLDALRIGKDSRLAKSVKLINPFGEDQSLMRTTLIADMLKVMSTNKKAKLKTGAFYEIGRAFIDENEKGMLPTESNILCIGMYGDDTDFFSLKGVVEALLSSLGIVAALKEYDGEYKCFHPGRKAAIILEGAEIGVMGEIHPEVAADFEDVGRVYVAHIDLDIISKNINYNKTFKPLPKYPGIIRDLSMVVSKDVLAGDLKAEIWRAGGKYLKEVSIFDVYEGEQVGKNKKSIAFSMLFRADDKTLSDDEIVNPVEDIINALANNYNAEIRK